MKPEKSNGCRTLSIDERDKIDTALHEARALSNVMITMEVEEYIHGEIATFAHMIFERVMMVEEIIKGAEQA